MAGGPRGFPEGEFDHSLDTLAEVAAQRLPALRGLLFREGFVRDRFSPDEVLAVSGLFSLLRKGPEGRREVVAVVWPYLERGGVMLFPDGTRAEIDEETGVVRGITFPPRGEKAGLVIGHYYRLEETPGGFTVIFPELGLPVIEQTVEIPGMGSKTVLVSEGDVLTEKGMPEWTGSFVVISFPGVSGEEKRPAEAKVARMLIRYYPYNKGKEEVFFVDLNGRELTLPEGAKVRYLFGESGEKFATS